MSADGRYVAFLSGSGDDTVLMTFDRTQAGSAFKRVAASEPGKFDLAWCRWANEKRLLCSVYGNIRGKKYAEPPFKRLFAVDADGTALKTLEQSRDEGNLLVSTTSARNFNMNYGAQIERSNNSELRRLAAGQRHRDLRRGGTGFGFVHPRAPGRAHRSHARRTRHRADPARRRSRFVPLDIPAQHLQRSARRATRRVSADPAIS